MPNANPRATIRGSSVEMQAKKTVSISENAASIPAKVERSRVYSDGKRCNDVVGRDHDASSVR